ncbi:hypothetical protein NOZE110980_12050 [Nocardioides zeicaulis]
MPASRASCPGCHLPISDVRRHASRGRRRSWARGLVVRLTGLVLYIAIVAWSAWQLPAALPFVVPAAAAGVALHGVRGRPWLGAIAFVVLVVALPAVLAPALGIGSFSDLTAWINDPQW